MAQDRVQSSVSVVPTQISRDRFRERRPSVARGTQTDQMIGLCVVWPAWRDVYKRQGMSSEERRLMCSVGGKPIEEKVRNLVAWIGEKRET